MTLSDLARRCGGVLAGEDARFDRYALDSSDAGPGAVFVAIRGARVDGHDFWPRAREAGAVAALVERPVEGRHVLVPDIVTALADFGRSLRAEFDGPVVGVTGSNGKTTAKEFIAAALSPRGPVLKNISNQNSEYTSPLTWFGLRPEHRAAVIEMGMRGFGQIEHLASISRPTHGLITMIGTAHLEMVGSREGIVRAKTELFRALPADGMAFAWAEDDFLPALRGEAPCRFRTFGFSPDADFRVLGYRVLDIARSEIRTQFEGEVLTVELPTLGRHNALNAAAALLVATSLGVPFADAAANLCNAELPPMRLEVLEWRGARVVLDSYNASPDSTVAALRTLAELACEGRRWAVLGEMKELGSATESGHRLVGRELGLCPVEGAILLGEPTAWIEEEAQRAGMSPDRIESARDVEDIRQWLQRVQPGDLVLVKGSRALGLEGAL